VFLTADSIQKIFTKKKKKRWILGILTKKQAHFLFSILIYLFIKACPPLSLSVCFAGLSARGRPAASAAAPRNRPVTEELIATKNVARQGQLEAVASLVTVARQNVSVFGAVC
jgi:hypothetical protein